MLCMISFVVAGTLSAESKSDCLNNAESVYAKELQACHKLKEKKKQGCVSKARDKRAAARRSCDAKAK